MANEQPATANEQLAAANEQPATANEQPAMANEQPATANEQLAAANEEPAMANEAAAADASSELTEVPAPEAAMPGSSRAVEGEGTPEKASLPQEQSPSAEPEVPKRGKSAYMLFCGEERSAASEAVRARLEKGTLLMPEVGKELGLRWGAADAATKAKFQELAAQQKEQYEAAVKEYIELTGHKPQSRKRRAKIMSAAQAKAKGMLKDAETDAATQSTPPDGQAGDEVELVTPPRKAPKTVRRRPLTTMDIDAKVLAEVQQLSLEGQFMEFAGSPEVLEKGILAKKAVDARQLLKDLRKSNGSVEEARRRMADSVVIIV